MSKNGDMMKSIFGIIIIGIIAILSLNQELNGELIKYSIGAIVILALGVQAIEYFLNRGG